MAAGDDVVGLRAVSPLRTYKRFYVTRRDEYTAVTRVISVKIPVALVERMDELIERGYFQNRADVVREAVRRLLVDYCELLSERPRREVGVR